MKLTDLYYDINEAEKIEPDSETKIQAENTISNYPVYFFDTQEFHLYHQKNAKEVFKLIFMDESSVTAFCYIGYNGSNNLKAPYSSPFSDIYTIKKPDSVLLEKILSCLKDYVKNMNSDLYFTLPPIVCDKDFAVKTASFLDSGFKLDYAHVSNYYDLTKIDSAESFPENQSHSFRKNIKRALNSDLKLLKNYKELSEKILSKNPHDEAKNSFQFKINKDINKINSDNKSVNYDLHTQNKFIHNADICSYNVIQKNREEKQFPLAMSFDQIKAVENMQSSHVDYFVVSKDETDIAAAIVFKVSEEMVQVIYWGSLADYSKYRPMEFLAMSLIEHYKSFGISYIDIGPSTVDDKISHGLLAFKKNIGCKTTLKMSFSYKREL